MTRSGAEAAPAPDCVSAKPKRTLKLYKPFEKQLLLHHCLSRFVVAVFGRQSGKSTAAINHIIREAWTHPGGMYWFVSPIYASAKVIFRRMRRLLKNVPKHEVSFNKSELSIEFTHGGRIECKSGKEYDNLRTETLNGCVIDEVREQPPELWPLVISPMLATTKGWCWFISTPNGFDQFYDLFKMAEADDTGEWASFQFPSWLVSMLWTESEVASARKRLTEDQFAQEVGAEFRNIFSGRAYKSSGSYNKRDTSPFCADGGIVSPYLPVVVGLDFNVSPMCWLLGQTRTEEWYWFHEIRELDTNTSECAPLLVEKLLELKKEGRLKARPNVILCGDATGESRNTKATESDYDIITNALTDAGITWENRTPDSNPPVKTRVNTMNAKLKAADDTVAMWYHAGNCPYFEKDLDRVAWKEGSVVMLDQKKDKTLTHMSDAAGYPVAELTPIQGIGGVGTLKVIRR